MGLESESLYHMGAWEGKLCMSRIGHFDGAMCSIFRVRVVNQVLEILTSALVSISGIPL